MLYLVVTEHRKPDKKVDIAIFLFLRHTNTEPKNNLIAKFARDVIITAKFSHNKSLDKQKLLAVLRYNSANSDDDECFIVHVTFPVTFESYFGSFSSDRHLTSLPQ